MWKKGPAPTNAYYWVMDKFTGTEGECAVPRNNLKGNHGIFYHWSIPVPGPDEFVYSEKVPERNGCYWSYGVFYGDLNHRVYYTVHLDSYWRQRQKELYRDRKRLHFHNCFATKPISCPFVTGLA